MASTANVNLKQFFYLAVYLTALLVMALNLPKSVSIYYEERAAIIGFGIIGIWRYTWWLNHVIRSFIYGRIVFPRRRQMANQLWESGLRPKRILFMMTTFKELPSTTEKVLHSILNECHDVGVPAKLFIGIGTDLDQQSIEHYFSNRYAEVPLEVIIVRQKRPGKRYAIGETLRVIQKHGLEKDDPVIFMDGDTYFEPGCLRLCLPFFHLFPKMQALTTHEQALINNSPVWFTKWLEMRFAQRDLTMQSYSLSNKILTLTGRMSIFRGKHLLEPGFLEIIENDSLKHWLWGEYRFLSGDDKSTWYYLLKKRADIFYIPDALTITIEYVHGSALDRMKENLRRWSGNTLRNGERAIALGPKRTGYFIWWCLIDQRLTIWTMLFGHMIIFVLAFTKSVAIILVSFIWIALSRLTTSLMLFMYARRIDMSFPFLIYINQLMTTIIKIYILFRLPQQRWTNRGNQQTGFDAQKSLTLRSLVASYLTLFYCTCCLLFVIIYLGLITIPNIGDIKTLVVPNVLSD